MTRALIIGYGNPLRGDDGVGWTLAALAGETLGRRARAITVHQLTPELAEPISRADRVIFVDACMDRPPGDVASRPLSAGSADCAPFTHDLSPEGLLLLARTLYGRAPEGVLVSIGGARFELEESLSATVTSALPEALRRIEEAVADEPWPSAVEAVPLHTNP